MKERMATAQRSESGSADQAVGRRAEPVELREDHRKHAFPRHSEIETAGGKGPGVHVRDDDDHDEGLDRMAEGRMTDEREEAGNAIDIGPVQRRSDRDRRQQNVEDRYREERGDEDQSDRSTFLLQILSREAQIFPAQERPE